ncbi:MAG TPA: malto-oligosyltrehalose synthase [Alphaproteobacteria bacterium]|nr:malto-oligosyltrehalose synthase [Alphaproteobacteria bacterium]
MTSPELLRRICELGGIIGRYRDALGQDREASPDTIRALVHAFGYSADTDEDAQRTIEALEHRVRAPVLPPVVVAVGDEPLIELPIVVPAGTSGRLTWTVNREDGRRIRGGVDLASLPVAETFEAAGGHYERRMLTLGEKLPLGYHGAGIRIASRPRAIKGMTTIIRAPGCCWRPETLEGEGRRWGIAVQLYNIRSERNWGSGDFTDLANILRGAARLGAAAVGVNPLHAMFPTMPQHASPYSPCSRLFLSGRYLDIEGMPDFAISESARRLVHSHAFQERLKALRQTDCVDYVGLVAAKLEIVEILYRSFRESCRQEEDSPRARDFRAFQARWGRKLRNYALYQVIAEHGARQGWGFGWRNWPEEYRDPEGPAAQAIGREQQERVEFYEYLQWQADLQMSEVRRVSERLGMSVGVYTDLAVGADGGGSDVWGWQDVIATDARAGAPPDPWNMKGQDWGLPPFHPLALREQAYKPFADLVRANMARGGALRIDHIIGLMRLYWIPAGFPPTDGAYIAYPYRELFAVLALESQRTHCMVIGEDLGTVPEGLSDAMREVGILSYRIFYFEQEADGRMRAPDSYPRDALVALSTHDLPTFPAYWEGKDIELKDRLDLWPTPQHREREMEARDRTRHAMGDLLTHQGLIEGTPESPPSPAVYEALARTPSRLMMVQLEDILGQVEQVNVPGTVSEYPNWRHKLRMPIEEIFHLDGLSGLAARINEFRGDRQTPRKAATRDAVPMIPTATYRLQLNASFTFDDVTRITPYLDALGISHAYCSPWLKARAGSTHGYDIIDHNAFNPELGGMDAFRTMSAALSERNIGHIVDFVPNHMGVGKADNPWWLDVLEWGRQSPYAVYFDIDWNPTNPRLADKVLLPFLGDQYGRELESGKLVPGFDPSAGTFGVRYYDNRFPLSPYHYGDLIRDAITIAGPEAEEDPARLEALDKVAVAFDALAEDKHPRHRAHSLQARLAELAIADSVATDILSQGMRALGGMVGDRTSFQKLHELLEKQNYRLAYWGVASDEVNYRRFFNISDLAGICVENADLFSHAHKLVCRLMADGSLNGLRIDHIDGLFHPLGYLRRLRELAAMATGRDDSIYLVVEKILARHEKLREDWPIHGTTGYDFLAQVNSLLVDQRGEATLTRTYERFVARDVDFDEALLAAKHFVMESILNGELHSLARDLDRLSEEHWSSRDFTLEGLRAALKEVVAAFPVYRTYVTADGATAEDRRDITWAVGQARKRWRAPGKEMFDFIEGVLTTDIARNNGQYPLADVARFAMRVQQYTGPVMAKGFEDTAFYRYNRLSSLCEVGSDPRVFGISVAAFHHLAQERAQHWPNAMLATATHDTKRGEDARARIGVISERPLEWTRHISRWTSLNRRRKQEAEGQQILGRNDEYLLYQGLIGSWPLGFDPKTASEPEREAFLARVKAYMLKASREAKVRTSWSNPNTDYETALERFIAQILHPVTGRPFLANFLPFQADIARLGMLNSLTQTVLKLTCPGVSDIYQGCELWDFSFVDPDNRRPVDYEARMRALARLSALDGESDRADATARMRDDWHDGAIKLFLVRELIVLRNRHPQLFAVGGYRPLDVAGPMADRVCAFQRHHENVTLVVAVGRHFSAITKADATLPDPRIWGDTSVAVPTDSPAVFRDVLTGRHAAMFDGALRLDTLFATLPVSVLLATR